MTREPPKQRAQKKQSWSYIIRSGLAGGLAGCAVCTRFSHQAKTAIAPLDRVKILFQASNPDYQKYSGRWLGFLQAGQKIVQQQGILGLFHGHSATLLRIFPYATAKYMAYDFFHMALMPTPKDETSLRLFLAGSMSGVLSVFLTYPLDLVRVRLAYDTKSKPQPGSLRNIVCKIYNEGIHVSTDGTPPEKLLLNRYPILKFYRGFCATVMGMVPYAGTSFLVFGRTKSLMYRLLLNQDTRGHPLSPDAPQFHVSRTTVDLASGALAGAISQTASYPFEVIRRRLQVGGILHPERMMRFSETAAWIYKTNGISGFYIGLGIGYLKVVPMTAISFAVWSGMKRYLGV
ncbi:coenzyme A transporter [Malassezia nana]|uniref:Coenzyme A transporter n=1 Tax=Malassezia nana TaxID=180528 RepID=A0AAF0J516_9BASI|nr:coenzyme A transporter [Malassezia nana]